MPKRTASSAAATTASSAATTASSAATTASSAAATTASSAAAAKGEAAAVRFSAHRFRVRDLIAEIADVLGGVEARSDAMELIAALHDMPKHWPMLQAEEPIAPEMRKRALAAAEKKASGAPLQYAVGHADFRALTLCVDERVLIPRPETELLVDLVLNNAIPGGVAVDVGTGSGAIAIAMATEGRFDRVVATDISRDALDVATGNAARHSANVEFISGDLLGAVPAPVTPITVVVSNPPYISFEEIESLPASVRDWEPPVALFSSGDGLDATAQLVRQAAARLVVGGLLALEVDARRASLVAELVSSIGAFAGVRVEMDLFGRERFVLGTRRRT